MVRKKKGQERQKNFEKKIRVWTTKQTGPAHRNNTQRGETGRGEKNTEMFWVGREGGTAKTGSRQENPRREKSHAERLPKKKITMQQKTTHGRGMKSRRSNP